VVRCAGGSIHGCQGGGSTAAPDRACILVAGKNWGRFSDMFSRFLVRSVFHCFLDELGDLGEALHAKISAGKLILGLMWLENEAYIYIYIHMYTAIRHTVKARPKNISCSNLKHGDSKSNPTMCTVWAQNAKSEGLYMVVLFLFAC